MSEANFTKGPWTKRNGHNCIAIESESTGFGICFTCLNEIYDEANAHLIAAAPEMYEMLERVMGNYQVAASAADHEGYVTGYDHDAALVDALLAKARGE